MAKQNYIIIGVAVAAALAFGFIAGRGIKGGNGNPTTARSVDVADRVSPTTRSFSPPQPINYQETITHYLEILKKEPENAGVFARLGDVYFEMQRFEDTIKYYKRAIELDPTDVGSYNDLGLSYHYTGSSEEGLKYIEDGIKVDPLFQRIWLSKGFVLATTGNIPEAITAWDKAYAIDPNTEIAQAALDFLNQYRPISRMEGSNTSQ